MTATQIQRPPPAVDHLAVAERTQAARSLLQHPLITVQGPFAEDLRLVRRHQSELVKLFAEGLGYRLVVEPGAARLFKTGLGRDSSRPLLKRSGVPFAPRAYAFLCLTIAALTRAKGQLLVDELVAQVRSAAADAKIAVDQLQGPSRARSSAIAWSSPRLSGRNSGRPQVCRGNPCLQLGGVGLGDHVHV